MVLVKKNKKSAADMAAKKEKINKHKRINKDATISVSNTRLSKSSKKRISQGRKEVTTKLMKKRDEQDKKKLEIKKKKDKENQDDEAAEHFDTDGYLLVSDKLEISREDQILLEKFKHGFKFGGGDMVGDMDFGELISSRLDEKMEEKREEEIKDDILKDPKVKLVYSDIAKLMREYTSGKLAKAFKAIPLIDQWEKVLNLTKPDEWTPNGMYAATKVLCSSLDNYNSRIFFEKYLLKAVLNDIQKHKKLSFHYYQALIKAFYKPAAWFKGILFPLCSDANCTLKTAQIIASILQKLSIPVIHSSVALLKMSNFEFSGQTSLFMKALISKKYALPARVISSLVIFFTRYENDERQLPVVWHQLLLKFCELYKENFDEMQVSALKVLIKKKNHPLISPEILKAIDSPSSDEIKKKNLQRSLQNTMSIE